MPANEEQYYSAWLARAADDELSTRAVLKEGAPSTGCFLAQQMVEKYLKAMLVFHGRHVRKIHDLLELETLLVEVASDIGAIHEDLRLLNRYYIEPRYPADMPEFTLAECREAFEAALRIKEFVLRKINPPVS